MTIRCLLIAVASIIAIVGLVVGLTMKRLDDAYAQWGAADMIIDYMNEHDGRWPANWHDLRPYFDAGGSRVSGWSFEKFQQHVWIDFSADSNKLRQLSQNSEQPPFNVVSSTSVFGSQFDDGPNGMLHRHFNPNSH